MGTQQLPHSLYLINLLLAELYSQGQEENITRKHFINVWMYCYCTFVVDLLYNAYLQILVTE